ncbi:hypothetical protein AB8871_04515 [Chlamydia trachomatis]|uniref:hypothetical protein n=1 Tax=Chlamydia trachomatis TaxID=813 RepID=UPI0039BDDC79
MLSPIFYAPIFYQLPKKPFFLTSQFIPSHTILNTFYKTKFSSLFFFFLLKLERHFQLIKYFSFSTLLRL